MEEEAISEVAVKEVDELEEAVEVAAVKEAALEEDS